MGKATQSYWSNHHAKEKAKRRLSPEDLLLREAQAKRMIEASAKLGNDKPKVLRVLRQRS
jgi:hypothetical protein